MAKSSTRLVLICGLPASGKSTLARQLAPKIPAIRLDKDGWATQLGADLWDEEFRVRLEHQLWVLSQDLLARGQSVILEWGHWARVCLLYTSDAADDLTRVDLGGRRIIQK